MQRLSHLRQPSRRLSTSVSLLSYQRDHIVLGLKPGSSRERLKKAYYDRAWHNHPDRKPPEERHAAERTFQDIQQAYQRLISGITPYDSGQRRPHDYMRSRFIEFLGVHRREFETTMSHVLRSVLCNRKAPRQPPPLRHFGRRMMSTTTTTTTARRHSSTTAAQRILPEALSRVRTALASGGVKSCALAAVVENIHNRPKYAEYAAWNTAFLTPHAKSLCVVSREYAADMPHFEHVHCGANRRHSFGQSSVDRSPLVYSSGDTVLRWVADEGYLSENAARRHDASGPSSLYAFWSERDDLFDEGGTIDDLRSTLHAQQPLPLMVVETKGFAAETTTAAAAESQQHQGHWEALDAHFAACGARRSLTTRVGATATGGVSSVLLEGNAPDLSLTIYRFPSWDALNASVPATQQVLRELEEESSAAGTGSDGGGGVARAFAYEVGGGGR